VLAWLKSNWYIPLFVAGVIVAIVAGQMGAGVDGPAAPDTQGATGETADPRQQALRAEFERGKKAETARGGTAEPAAERSTDEIIAEHVKALESSPDAEESAGRLAALGNLHRQKKQDYRAAAGYYERLIQDYPNWPGVGAIYHQLISCYTQLNDQESLRLLYRKMVEVFPAESKEYEYARYALDHPGAATPGTDATGTEAP
jgi:tetratricopeptide (TPR) repeat protein